MFSELTNWVYKEVTWVVVDQFSSSSGVRISHWDVRRGSVQAFQFTSGKQTVF